MVSGEADEYMTSISREKSAMIGSRLMLIFGVRCPLASVNSVARIVNLRIDSARETRRRDGSSYAARDLEFLSIEATDRPDYDLLGQHLSEAADFLERVGAAGESVPAQAGAEKSKDSGAAALGRALAAAAAFLVAAVVA